MRSLRTIFALIFAVSLLQRTAVAQAQDTTSDAELRANATFVTEVVRLTNIERVNRGLLPLRQHTQLDAAAQSHSDDMAANMFMAHQGSDGSTFGQRATRSGYPMWGGGENVAPGYPTPETVVAGWMGSAAHRDNILSTSFREIGVGYASSTRGYRNYWTQILGSRQGAITAFVNDDAATTATREVTIRLANPTELGAGASVAISEHQDFASAAAQPWAASIPFILSAGDGEKRVFVRFSRGSTSYIAEDTITLGSGNPALQLSIRDVRLTIARDGTALPRSIVIRVTDGTNPIRVTPTIAVSWLNVTQDNDGDLTLTLTDPAALAALGTSFTTSVNLSTGAAPAATHDATIQVSVRVVEQLYQRYLPTTQR